MIIDSIQWLHPSTTILAGPSSSGKTTLLSTILENKNTLFTEPNLKTILYLNQNQEIYNNWFRGGLISYASKGIPSIEDFKTIIKYHSTSGVVSLIFDDLGAEILTNLEIFKDFCLFGAPQSIRKRSKKNLAKHH